ncbi:MAG: lipid-A-disaccharide synthase [Chlamydiales bacterium]|nr:lipid-A-disaccharide synthase [Chlamydiales bacterium]
MIKSLCDLFIFAGEPSGDLHGSSVLKVLKEKAPQLKVEGVFGPKMRSQVNHSIIHTEEFHVMGFSDVLKALPRLKKHFKTILKHILTTNPKVVLLIDYPGFNLRLARSLRENGYKGKLIHYICPSVWAWKKNRIKSMEKTLDLLLCIFPFEPKYFEKSSLKAIYVGNPSLEAISSAYYDDSWKRSLNIPKSHSIISLFPGSREGEITKNLPVQLESALKLKQEYPDTTICISVANENTSSLILSYLKEKNISPLLIPERYNFDLMKNSRVAIAKCGTVTLELALNKTPTVVTYQLSKLNAFFAKYIFQIKLPFYCIVNILLNKQVFPELIYKDFTQHNTYLKAKDLFLDGPLREQCLSDCNQLIQCLDNSSHPSHNVADTILKTRGSLF